MHFTGSGKLSAKPAKGRNFRSYLRMEQLARLEATGLYSNKQIAAFLNVHTQTLIMIKSRPEYHAIRMALTTGVLTTLTDEARLLIDNQIEELKELVPAALSTLRSTLIRGNALGATPSERKLAFEASREVFDREGTFAKVARAEITVTDEVDLEREQAINDDLLAMLNVAHEAKRQDDPSILDAFVNSSGSKDVQLKMAERIKLEDFEPPKDRPVN